MLTKLASVAGAATPPPPVESTATADRLHSAAIHLLRAVRREDARLGIGPAQLSALSVLVFGGRRTISGLARVEQVRLPTMSRIVAALERAGLVAREPDPRDGRGSVVCATTRGRHVMQRGRALRVAELARRLSGLAPPDHELLHRAAVLIERLAAARPAT